jgi:hypothetical protein
MVRASAAARSNTIASSAGRQADLAHMNGIVPGLPKRVHEAGDNALSTRNFTPWK